jgi:hypothetical protein
MSNEKKGFIEKYGAILGLISLALSIVTVPATYYFAFRSDYLSQITSNYETQLIPYVAQANVAQFYYTGSSVLNAYGFITLSIVVVTPHALIINCSDFLKQTTIKYKLNSSLFQNGSPIPLFDSSKSQYNTIYAGVAGENTSAWANEPIFPSSDVPPYSQKFIAYVQEGISQVNFSIPIHVNFYLSQAVFDNMLQAGGSTGCYAQLADFSINVAYYDVQTKVTLSQRFSGTIDTYLWVDTPVGMFG